MSFRGKKTLAVAGLVLCAITISGVAGAEQRPQQDDEIKASLQRASTGQEQQSNASDQYADQNSGSDDAPQSNKPEDSPEAPEDGESNGQDSPRGEDKGGKSDDKPRQDLPDAGSQSRQTQDSSRAAGSSNDETERRGPFDGPRGGDDPRVDGDRKVQSPTIQRRVRQLEAQERAGEIRRAATGYSAERKPRELRIAREEIVAEPVGEPVGKAELRKYKELYEEAAEDYGFAEDWYILAAVGKVESDHGQNMGPSSAGALGPMQFMPSTWDSYGVDANGDGEANIMDPEDAIPSAAKYLKAGGAPDDWYEALFTYNHAGWYVEDVLEVAEGYRQAAGDDEVEPYYLENR